MDYTTTPGAQLADYEDIDFDVNKGFSGDINTNVSSPAGFTGMNSKGHLSMGGVTDFNKTGIPGGNTNLQFSGVMTTGFKDFLFKPELMRAITDCGFEHPSEVQQECIPQAMMGTDIICQAKSGMGKTAVFVLTSLQHLEDDPKPLTLLVMCHTRELAYQIKSEYVRFMKYLDKEKNTVEVIYGGQPIQDHIKMLKKKPPTVLIGTPGRILSLVKSKHLKMEHLKHFILDECDQMLEALDMRQDVQNIFKATPHEKQVMMFSATFKPEVRSICREFMKSPYEVQIDNEQRLTLHGLQQYYSKLDEDKKNRKLVDLLDHLQFNQVIIFVSQVKRADALSKLLYKQGFPSICMHSRLSQEDRLKRYKEFKDFQKRIMVSTDIFGRGIDMGKVNVVINYDMPIQMENQELGRASDQYLHRVGRAGRFGTKGLTIAFVSSTGDQEVLVDIQKRFEVKMQDLPAVIDQSSYMNN